MHFLQKLKVQLNLLRDLSNTLRNDNIGTLHLKNLKEIVAIQDLIKKMEKEVGRIEQLLHRISLKPNVLGN